MTGKRHRLGVTVGKFLPLHLGHVHLLAESARRCDRLVVLVGDRPGQPFSGRLRAAWLREVSLERELDLDVRVVVDDLPEAPEPWAARTIAVLGRRPDVVFTSEDYGPRWAALMGADHEAIDPDRATAPISGSAVRADLGGNWRFLPPPVRASLAPRIVVLGVESSGTTTLAEALAARYRTVWAPEYGRWYWEGRRHLPGDRWTTDEFVAIATAQGRLIDDLARQANRVVIADTDGWATHVWHRRYVGTWSPRVAAEAVAAPGRRADLHLLTAPDFPFVQDGTRDGERIRDDMHGWFLDLLTERGLPHLVVSGSHEERMVSATRAIDRLLDDTDPIPDGPAAPVAWG